MKRIFLGAFTYLAVMVPLAVGCADDVAPRRSGMLQVESVDIVQLESLPVQVTARVTGTVPDACTGVDTVNQTRNGNDITVTITTVSHGEVCAQVITRVTHDVRLTGGFPPGRYVLRVNGFETAFTIAG